MIPASLSLRRPVRIDLSLFSRSAPAPRAHTPSPVAGLISQIIEINPSATSDFLARFAEPALREYLSHLQTGQEPRGRGSTWVRSAGRPAIVTRAAKHD